MFFVYCGGAYSYHDSSFNAPEVQPLKWTVYNGTYEKRTSSAFATAKNISDTPVSRHEECLCSNLVRGSD